MLPMDGIAILNSQRKFALERSAGLSACMFKVLGMLGGSWCTFLCTCLHNLVCLPDLLHVHMAPNPNESRSMDKKGVVPYFFESFNVSRHSEKCFRTSRLLFSAEGGSFLELLLMMAANPAPSASE